MAKLPSKSKPGAGKKQQTLLSAARRTISKLKEINREQLLRIQDYYLLKKLREAQDKELTDLRIENKQLDNTIEQLRERLRKYEPNA